MKKVLGTSDVPAPPDRITCSLHEVAADRVLHRIHDQRFSGTSFNPGLGFSRFAPFEVGGSLVPFLYAATSLECAVFETIFHDIEPSAPYKSVPWSALDQLHWSTFRLGEDASLAALFTPDLMRWGLERSDLIDTPRSAYFATQAWSPALHQCAQQPAGLIWTSRRFDQDTAMILFGDRVVPASMKLLSTVKVTTDVHCMSAIHSLADRADISIIR